MNTLKTFILLVFSFLLITSCQREKTNEDDTFSVSVRIPKDPNFLNPLKSTAVTESLVNQYLFLPLANYDPATQQLIPVLIEAIPEGKLIEAGTYAGSLRFDCTIREDATWGDGKPITGYDYYFTFMAIGFEPLKINPAVRSVFREMKGVIVDKDNPKNFQIYVDSDFLLAKELSLIAEMLPEHIYDPSFSLREHKMNNAEELNVSLQLFIDNFNHADCGRKLIEGSGPYEVSEWQTNQRIILRQKQNYWGDKVQGNAYLSTHPAEIVFSIYPSENTAITELKSGALDLMYNLDGNSFSRLRDEDKLSETLEYFNPAQLKYYYLGINNKSVFFDNAGTRKALAHLVDIDAIINNQENGLGVRTIGPILPYRTYYNDTIIPIEPDLQKAKELLATAGWTDSDQNGILDKNINGKLLEFKPQIIITGSALGKNIALTLKENARPAGIDIEIVTKNSKLVRNEIARGNFDLYPTGKTVGLFPEDLHPAWHTDNDYPGGSNKYGVGNADMDVLIDLVRSSSDSTIIDDTFRKIQAEIHDQQYMIFLYSPTNNIVVNKRIEPLITIKKPGFFLNEFKLKK